MVPWIVRHSLHCLLIMHHSLSCCPHIFLSSKDTSRVPTGVTLITFLLIAAVLQRLPHVFFKKKRVDFSERTPSELPGAASREACVVFPHHEGSASLLDGGIDTNRRRRP